MWTCTCTRNSMKLAFLRRTESISNSVRSEPHGRQQRWTEMRNDQKSWHCHSLTSCQLTSVCLSGCAQELQISFLLRCKRKHRERCPKDKPSQNLVQWALWHMTVPWKQSSQALKPQGKSLQRNVLPQETNHQAFLFLKRACHYVQIRHRAPLKILKT